MRRLLKWLLILAVVLGGLAAAGHFGQQYMRAKAAPKFLTASASTGKVEAVVNSTGPVKPVQSVSVGSFVSGPILEINVDFNTVVSEKQVLARIDPRITQAACDREVAGLATQKAELTRIRAQLAQARRNEDRALALRKTNRDYISDQEVDQLHFARKALEAQDTVALANIDVAEATVKNAQANLDYTWIRAPVSGVVIDRKVERGQTVAAGFQTPELFIIAPDLDTMHVYAAVDEADIGQIRAAQEQGRPVTFTVDAYPEDVFTGAIHQVRMNATTTQNVVTYPVIVAASNPGLKLRPQMTASVSFQIDVRENVTRIPAAALRFVPPDRLIRPEDKQYVDAKARRDPKKEGEEKLSAERRAEQAKARSKRVVWVPDGDMVRAVPVTIGLTDPQYAELVAGDVAPGLALVTGLEGEDDRARR